jgi:hypothetical protein
MESSWPQTSFSRLSLLLNGVKETAKDLHAVAIADLGQTRMLGKRFVQIVVE